MSLDKTIHKKLVKIHDITAIHPIFTLHPSEYSRALNNCSQKLIVKHMFPPILIIPSMSANEKLQLL